jgi:hypothetical protein
MGKSLAFLLLAMGTAIYATAPQPSAPTNGAAEDFVRWLFTQGGFAVIAAAVIYAWRRDMHEWRKKEQDRADDKSREVGVLLVALRDSTAALTQLNSSSQQHTEAIDRMTHAVDRLADRIK